MQSHRRELEMSLRGVKGSALVVQIQPAESVYLSIREREGRRVPRLRKAAWSSLGALLPFA